MSNHILDINNICTNIKYTISNNSYYLENYPNEETANTNYIHQDNSFVLAQYAADEIVGIKINRNKTEIISKNVVYDNTYLLYYQFPQKLSQMTYLINETNGLYYNGNYISLGIDDYSIKEISNKLFYNINSIPYSTKTFNGILYLNNAYIANESIQANNALVNKLLMQENTLSFYNKQLNIIKDHVLFYRYIKSVLLSHPNQITFTKRAFKQNIISASVEKQNTSKIAKTQTIYKDINYWDGNSAEGLQHYTYFHTINTFTYDIESDLTTYLSLNNTYIKYCDNYYFNNNLLPREYKPYFYQGLENNGNIYCKSIQDLEFNIYTNYFDNEITNKEDNNIFNTYNIYMRISPNLLNSISLISNCNYVNKTSYLSSNISYANYSNNTLYYTNSSDNLKFKYANTYVSLSIAPSCSYFNYKLIGENMFDDTNIYSLGTNHIISSYNKNILAYIDCNIYDNIRIYYDTRNNITNTQIIDVNNYQNSYMILFEYNTNLGKNDSFEITNYLYNILLKYNCIFYNKEPYLFYGYYEVTTNDNKVYKKYRDIANKNIPLQFAKLNSNIITLNYIINDTLLIENFDNLEFAHTTDEYGNTITTTKKLYIGELSTNTIKNIISINI